MSQLNGLEYRRSQITLSSTHELSELIDFRRLKRARKPVSRSRAGVQGKVADVYSGRSRHAESQNELRGFQVLLATGRTDAWQEQPFRLDYHHAGARHCYTPDILVAWGAHREVVEIKDDAEADLPANRERFALIRELLEEHGFLFRVWRRSEIIAEPRFANVGLMLRYRCAVYTLHERENIRRAFASISRSRLRIVAQAQGISIQSMLRMVLDGTLHINWWEAITLDSEISTTPIGPQLWPSPPHGVQPLNRVWSIDATIRI